MRIMEANAGLVAGSHNRNELVVIRPDSEGVSPNLDLPSIFGPSCGVGVSRCSFGILRSPLLT